MQQVITATDFCPEGSQFKVAVLLGKQRNKDQCSSLFQFLAKMQHAKVIQTFKVKTTVFESFSKKKMCVLDCSVPSNYHNVFKSSTRIYTVDIKDVPFIVPKYIPGTKLILIAR